MDLLKPTPSAALLGAALLAGCPGPAKEFAPPPAVALPGASQSPSATRQNHLSPATRSLVSQADGLVAQGNLDGASATLDRALRIEPDNPLLWIELGNLRLRENDAHQAENCARKALALAGRDPAVQTTAGRLLDQSLLAAGHRH